MCGIQKDDTDEPVCRGRNREADLEKGLVDLVGEGRGMLGVEA